MSVFLDVPGEAWVCSNQLAFAFRDRLSVSPGHALIVSRRVIPDWFAATADERMAILELVELVKTQLEPEEMIRSETTDGASPEVSPG